MDPFQGLNTIEEVDALFRQYEAAGEGQIYWAAANRRKLRLHYIEREFSHILYFITVLILNKHVC